MNNYLKEFKERSFFYQCTNEKELFDTYCQKYHNSNLGGSKPRFDDTNFYGYSLSKFAIELLPEEKEAKY